MEPLSAFSTAITSIKTATEIAQILKSVDSSFKEAETKIQIAELMSALADTKIAVSELKDLVIEKDNEIKKLTMEISDSKNLFYNGIVYTTNENDIISYYCPHCFDANKIKIRLYEKANGFYCMHCKSFYLVEQYR